MAGEVRTRALLQGGAPHHRLPLGLPPRTQSAAQEPTCAQALLLLLSAPSRPAASAQCGTQAPPAGGGLLLPASAGGLAAAPSPLSAIRQNQWKLGAAATSAGPFLSCCRPGAALLTCRMGWTQPSRHEDGRPSSTRECQEYKALLVPPLWPGGFLPRWMSNHSFHIRWMLQHHMQRRAAWRGFIVRLLVSNAQGLTPVLPGGPGMSPIRAWEGAARAGCRGPARLTPWSSSTPFQQHGGLPDGQCFIYFLNQIVVSLPYLSPTWVSSESACLLGNMMAVFLGSFA